MTSKPPTSTLNKPRDGVGLQLIIFGQQEKADFNAVVETARDTGYDYLETTLNFLGVPPFDLCAFIKAHILPVKAVHVGYPNIEEDSAVEHLIGLLRRVGASYLICSGQAALTIDPLITCRSTARRFNEVGALCKKNHLQFLVHAFDWAYRPSGGYIPLEYFLENTKPELVGFNIDLFWAAVGGQRLSQLIPRLRDRCNYYHLKDGNIENGRKREFFPLGEGEVPIAECIPLIADQASYYVVVEQDISSNLRRDLERSREFLRGFGI